MTATGQLVWHAAVCAPSDRPVRVLDGAFFEPDGRANPLPRKGLLHDGWGESSQVTLGLRERAVPAWLTVTWFSLTDNRFYGDSFELPVERIVKTVAAGFTDPVTRGRAAWDTFLVGLAPGGRLAVWLSGGGASVEVCHFRAREVSIAWKTLPMAAVAPRDEWVSSRLDRALGESGRRRLSSEGPDGERWDRYRQRWPWRPRILGSVDDVTLLVAGFNGEREFVTSFHAGLGTTGERSAPREMVLRHSPPNGAPRVARVRFDEAEIFAALAKLQQRAGASAQLELHVDLRDMASGLGLYLCDDRYSLELLAVHVTTYGAW